MLRVLEVFDSCVECFVVSNVIDCFSFCFFSLLSHSCIQFAQGCFFGEKSLLTKELTNADCVAKDQVECLVLTRSSFDNALGSLASILEKDAKKFSIMSRDWHEIHLPMVQVWLEDNGKLLKMWQEKYMTAEKDFKPGLLILIDPMTESIKYIKGEKKQLEKLLKSRSDTEGARKCITKLLMAIDAQNEVNQTYREGGEGGGEGDGGGGEEGEEDEFVGEPVVDGDA